MLKEKQKTGNSRDAACHVSAYGGIFLRVNLHTQVGCKMDYHEWLDLFSGGKIKSLTQLKPSEIKAFENYLDNPVETNNLEHDKLRKAIISQFLSIGRTVGYAIQWAETHGTHKEKKKFNDYDKKELGLLLAVAKTIKKQFEDKVWTEVH